jgi:hypothetical protein
MSKAINIIFKYILGACLLLAKKFQKKNPKQNPKTNFCGYRGDASNLESACSKLLAGLRPLIWEEIENKRYISQNSNVRTGRVVNICAWQTPFLSSFKNIC